MVYVVLAFLLISLGANLWLVWRLLLPLRRLSNQTLQLAQGDLSALQQPSTEFGEIERLRRTMASMARHVRRTQEDELKYRHSLTEGQEAERARIARELHDETVQSLIAIGQSIDMAVKWQTENPTRSAEILKMARQQSVNSVEGLRRLIANLRPPALEELGVVAALRMVAESEPELDIVVNVLGSQRRLPEEYELTLFRIVQEAIRNAQRHGQAKHIQIELDYRPNEVALQIQDDGVGFDVNEGLDCFNLQGRYGLLGIQERAQHLQGKVDMTSKLNQGTRVTVVLPLNDSSQPAHSVHDPVCGAAIQPHQAYGSTEYQGERYYFCCPVCQGAFQRDPQLYLVTTE
jgi:signal transduction histidine kinase/YHS domain-containing protein